jgi:hypothetical protein
MMSLVKQELLTLPELSGFSGVRLVQSLVFCVVFCTSLFVFLSRFFYPLYCLSFDLRLLVTPLVSSNFFIKVVGIHYISST